MILRLRSILRLCKKLHSQACKIYHLEADFQLSVILRFR